MKKSVANGLLVFVTVIWGGGFIATAAALETFLPFYVMMIRFVGSALLSFVIAFPRLKKIKTSTVIKGVVAGVFLFLAFSFQTFGLQQTTASKNAFLTATNVVFVPYLCWIIFRKRPGVRQIAASLICVVGISLLTLKGDSVSFGIGDFYSLLCAIFFACHIISLDWATKGEDVLIINAVQMLISGILSTFAALIFSMPPAVISGQAVLSSLYLIAVSTCLAFLLQTAAQKYTTASSASLILSMEALFASIFSFLLLHESMTVLMMFGGALILSSIVLVEYRRQPDHQDMTEYAQGDAYTVSGDEDEALCSQSEILHISESTCQCDRSDC